MIQVDPENKFSPLPEYLESHRDGITNFGLYFQKFAKYQRKKNLELVTQHNWDNGKWGKDKETFEWSLISNQFDQYKKHCFSTTLVKQHENQQKYLSAFSELGVKTVELSSVTSTRFLTGIGETTPTEVGMVFDRNSGLPYIPASSVKGAVRYAYCVNFARTYPEKINDGVVDEKDINGLIELFGSLDTKNSSGGGYAFMDVYSEQPPEVAIDIMNPHYGKYYKGESNDGPVETEEPVPIKFLAVEKGAVFKFRGFFLSKHAESYWAQLNKAFVTALTELGLGAKTAIGYGRFELEEGKTVKSDGKSDIKEPINENELEKNFNQFRFSPSPENFKKFIDKIKPEEIEELTALSFKGMKGSINIGFVDTLIKADVSEDIKSIVASKVYKLIKRRKKWNQEKLERYCQLEFLAGQK